MHLLLHQHYIEAADAERSRDRDRPSGAPPRGRPPSPPRRWAAIALARAARAADGEAARRAVA